MEFTGKDTFFGRTAALLGGTSEQSNLQKLIISIVKILTAVSVLLCLIVLIYLSTLQSFAKALDYFVVLLVASMRVWTS